MSPIRQIEAPFLESTLFGNSLRSWLGAVVVGLIVYFASGLIRTAIAAQVRRVSGRTQNVWDDMIAGALGNTRRWLYVALGVWAGMLGLDLPERARDLVITLVAVAILAQLGLWGTTAIRTYVGAYAERNLDKDAASVMTVRAIGFLGSVALWTIILLVFLENRGVDITALIAGLGIGGVAVALALQNLLGDLFASLSIVLDKPFVVGDFIVVGEELGTVQSVGLKTTRVRSLSGEELVFSNSDLLTSRIRNYKRMYERRVTFGFGVEYGTPRDRLEWISATVREVIEGLPDTRFDRAHFKEFGESSLDFEVVYYVQSPEFNRYMDLQQAINLEIYERFEEEGISFAFPTRTVQLVESGMADSARPSEGSRAN